MISDYWALTLVLGDTISLVLLAGASVLGVQVARRWDASSASSSQLSLERKSYLVSTIMTYVCGFQLLSLWLFIITVNDHFPSLIRGAMCGTGSLNANQFGWAALVLKGAEFILLSLWLSVHVLDRRVPEYPLTKEKFLALLVLAPIVTAAAVVQFLYLLNINPSIITTCCSVTFDAVSSTGRISRFETSLDESTAVRWFLGAGGTSVMAFGLRIIGRRALRTLGTLFVPVAGSVFGMISLYVITHHYAKYIYGMPSHHCPFDMLWPQYYFVGYVVYGLLAATVISSLIFGVISIAGKRRTLHTEADRMLRTTAICGGVSAVLLLGLLVGIEQLWR